MIMIVDLPQPASVPKLAEPWYLTFNADVSFHVVMNQHDLEAADFESLAKKWGDNPITPSKRVDSGEGHVNHN